MKNNQRFIRSPFLILFALFVSVFALAQNSPFSLGSEADFSNQLLKAELQTSNLELKLPNNERLEAIINVREISSEQNYFVTGKINSLKNASFSITKTNGVVEGHIILSDQNKGYQYTSGDRNDVLIKEIKLDKLLCIGLESVSNNESSDSNNASNAQIMVPILNSLPGSGATIYLDFDGEVVRGTSWSGGATIDAKPEGYSEAEMERIWEYVAEDFSAFNVNVTTDRSVFDRTPKNKRMMTIFTTTTTAAPGSGGVAYLNSFSRNNDDPCWVFNGRPGSIKSAGETATHEVGHTLGLRHDGDTRGAYHSGNGVFGPIMGANFRNPVGHWSKGEYPGANNNEDDLAIITRPRNFGYKNDDHAGTLNNATKLVADNSGNVDPSKNNGVITKSTDKDVFSFETSGGEVDFKFSPAKAQPNLNVQARILDASGNEVAKDNPRGGDLSASIKMNLRAGTYYIEIDGEGEGDSYTDYSSIGVFSISGTYKVGNNNQAPVANFIGDIECNKVAFESTSINTVNSYLWNFGDGNTSTEESPLHTYQSDGTYSVSLTVTNAIGSDTKTIDNFITVKTASLPNAANKTICSGANETLELSGSNGYVWYDAATGGNVVNTGNSLDLSSLTATQRYYVAGTTEPTLQAAVGENTINNSNGDIHQGGFYLVFDSEQPFLLKTAKVFADGTADRTLELRDNSGQVVASKVINIKDGESIIDINLTVPAGANLQAGFAQGAQLFRSNAGLNFPYNVDDVVSIKGSTASNPTGFYYYLYDWKISTLGECKTDDRTEVVITVNESPTIPVITFTQATNQLSVPDNYDNYQWFLNGVAINGANSPIFIARENGDYTVEVSNNGGNGCSSISEVEEVTTLSISDFIRNNFKIFPNPVNNELTILKTNGINLINAKINDVNGRLVKVIDLTDTVEQSIHINVSELSSGMYFMNISSQQGQGTVKIVKQ